MKNRLFLTDKIKPITTIHGLAFIFILAVFSSFFTAYTLYAPAYEGQDEKSHYLFTRAWELGTTTELQYFKHPPLYYLFNAAIFDLNDLPMANEIKHEGNPNNDFIYKNKYLHSTEEDFPFSGLSLAIHKLRLVSIVFGIVALVFTYKIAQLIIPNNKWFPLFSMAVVALMPRFLEFNATINNDAMTIPFVTISIFLLIKYVDTKKRKFWILLGIFIGLSMLAKTNAIVLYPVVFVTLLYLALSHQITIISFLKKYGGIVLISIPAGSWYILQKISTFASTVDIQQGKGIFRLFTVPLQINPNQIKDFEVSKGMEIFDFNFLKSSLVNLNWTGLMHGPIKISPDWIFIAELFLVISIVGLLLVLVKKISFTKIDFKKNHMVILLSSAGFMIMGVLTYLFFQGIGNIRYAIPVIAIFGILYSIGWFSFLDKKRLRLLLLVPLIFLVMLNIQLLTVMEQNYYHGFLDYRNPYETLVEFYETKPGLQKRFPEVRTGDFGGLVVWAVDKEVKKIKNVELRMQEPMLNLLKVYYSSEELQKTFPEVSEEHNLKGLTEWALSNGVNENPILKKNEFYFERYYKNVTT